VRGVRGVCACGHPLGAAAALAAFAAGGTAVDAAVAAAFALSVVLPESCGVGGEALLLVAPDGEPVTALGATGASPARLRGPIPRDGGGTVAVPAAVAGWLDAHERWGRLEPAQVLAPAVRLARDGFPVGADTLAALAAQRPRLERAAPGFPLLAGDLRPGSRVRQPALARTLERIAAEGRDALYRGELAAAIAGAVQADGGALSEDDLADHATLVGAPLRAGALGLEVTVQPPPSQATLALMALRALERAGPRDELERIHGAVEALEAAFAHRHELVDRAAAERLLAAPLEVDLARAARRGGPRGANHTTAVATADGDGLVVSMLISLFDHFGSALLVPEGGFLLNDRLLGFTSAPNGPGPRRRPVHTLSPILVDLPGQRLALATPGADGQVQTLVQLILHLAGGLPAEHALDRPRFRSTDGRLAVEADLQPDLLAGLEARGHDAWLRPPGEDRFGAAVVAGLDRETGTLLAAADPRRETWAVGW
jgi:gamma-glutamyltranspeptidase/glutathione hydrolase